MMNDYNDFGFLNGKHIWHLCTPGEIQCVIFRNSEDFRQGMNIVGVSASEFRDSVNILTFELMSNHVHFVVQGNKEDIESFFKFFRLKLRRILLRQNRVSDLTGFDYSLHLVDSENYLRTLILYVNRNGYVANINETPFSYEWGANKYFFNEFLSFENKIMVSSMFKRERDDYFHSKNISFPDNYHLVNGYISPVCYCKIKECECLFQSAHQYFTMISRNVESFKEIAQVSGDKIIYTDEEIFSACIYFARKNFEKGKLGALDKNEKIELAKHLHFNYNASNKQISRMLKIEESLLAALFPKTR